MHKNISRKGLVVGIIVLFLGSSVVSSINNDAEEVKNINRIENIEGEILTFNPTDDTQIYHIHPDSNFGSGLGISLQNEYGSGGSTGWACDGLIRFDMSSIPAGTDIKSAMLSLYYYNWDMTNPVGRHINLYRITSDWDEMTVTWNTQPTYSPELSAYSAVPSSTGVWMEWNLTEDVQDFISGDEINYGWKITDDTYWGQFDIPQTRFRPKDYGDYIPYLEIETENGGSEFKTIFIIGKITNLNTEEDIITFEAVNIRCIQFFPFGLIPYTSGELIIISEDYIGMLTPKFIFAVCGANI